MSGKLVLICIDAGEYDVISNNLHRLPSLRRLFGSGSVHRLESEGRDLAGSVWPTFATGERPGVHGIYYPMQWDPATMRLRRVCNSWLPVRAFWADMAQTGKAVCTMDASLEPQDLGELGLEVRDWGAHNRLNRLNTNNPKIHREILRRFGRAKMGRDNKVVLVSDDQARIREKLVKNADVKGKIASWLLGLRDWDFFLVSYGEAHRAGHLLWSSGDDDAQRPSEMLLEVYGAVDRSIGQLVEQLDLSQVNLVVFSLHGMGHQTSQYPVMGRMMDDINRAFLSEYAGMKAISPRRNNPMQILRRRVPPRLQDKIATAAPGRLRDWIVARSVAGGYDWAVTPGFSLLSDHSGYIRLNRVRREARGILVKASGEEQRYAELAELHLLSLVDPVTQEPIVEEIFSGPRRYPGPRADFLPDLVVNWREDRCSGTRIQSEISGEIRTVSMGRTGDHRRGGFAVFCGPLSGALDAHPPLHISDLARATRSLMP